MLSYYKGVIPIINDDPATRDIEFPVRDGDGNRITYGYVPRDYNLYPETMFDHPSQMELMKETDLDAWYDEQEAKKSSLEHIYLSGPGGAPRFVNLDQNGHGYCWAYSTGHAIMMSRLAKNLPIIRLNPHATAAIIKKGRDEGGWCGLSAQFAREHGYAEEGTGPGQWPLHSRNLQYDTPELRTAMAKYKVTEEYADLTRQVYDQNLTKQQFWTQLNMNNPCTADNSDWSHSVCAIRWVRVERGSWGALILNSWKGWGRYGLAVRQGSKGIPEGSVCTRSVIAA